MDDSNHFFLKENTLYHFLKIEKYVVNRVGVLLNGSFYLKVSTMFEGTKAPNSFSQ